jgi:ABC-type transporter Mla MlaB component
MQPIEFNDDVWFLKGHMTFEQIPILIRQTSNYVWNYSITIDLSQVQDVDTSLLGILFEWKRNAKIKEHIVSVRTPPENLIKLAKLYGVEDFI